MHYALATISTNKISQTNTQATPIRAVCLLITSAICLASIELCFNSITLLFGSCILFVLLISVIKISKFKHNEAASLSAETLRAVLGFQRWRRRQQERDALASTSLFVRDIQQQRAPSGQSSGNRNGSVNLQQFATTTTLNPDRVSTITSLAELEDNKNDIDSPFVMPNGFHSNNNNNSNNARTTNNSDKSIAINVHIQKFAILLCSSAWATFVAIKNDQLIPMLLISMFINYTLLAYHENKQVFFTLFIGNLLHIIAYLFYHHHHYVIPNSQSAHHHHSAEFDAKTTNQTKNISKYYDFNATKNEHSNQFSTNGHDRLASIEHIWFIVRHLLVILFTYATFHTIGLYLNRRNKADLKKSLRDTKDYVTSKIELDNEDKKFSKLMESVIPKHLAGQMRDDILCPTNKIRNFNPMYLTSYNNVSILFADIVNFTKISSNCSAQLLVETLNELFGRFDEAADARHCLRIKILGDCYYCVSGIPDEKQDHAKQCVEMGLDMIDILGDLSQGDKQQGVKLNMRVGIHTGRVLCGVMGKKRWQFDVHSNDVKLANHTEQSGVPGRVHITKDTLLALDGRYDVEPAYGDQRDTYIADCGISTYFVIPPPERRRNSLSSAKLMGLGSNVSAFASAAAAAVAAAAATQQVISSSATTNGAESAQRNGDNDSSNNAQLALDSTATRQEQQEQSVILSQHGQDNYHCHLEQQKQPREVPEQNQMEPVAGVAEGSDAVESDSNKIQSSSREALDKTITPADFRATLTKTTAKTLPSKATTMFVSSVPVELATIAEQPQPLMVTKLTPNNNKPQTVLAPRQRFKQTGKIIMNALHFIRTIDAPFANLDYQPSAALVDEMIRDAINARSKIKDINKFTLQFEDTQMQQLYISEFGRIRVFRGLLLYLCAFLSLNILIFSETYTDNGNSVPIEHLIATNQTSSSFLFDTNEQNDANDKERLHIFAPDQGQVESILLMVLFILLYIITTIIYTHQVELSARRDFVWRRMAHNDRKQMARVRDCNKDIFFNLLPKHVAYHFLSQKNIGHKDLYYHSYSLAGVMFATVTNFSDFYSEVEGNNNGLDCLRVLNEIICDFDSILEEDSFNTIDKIKTIGSTYMAAIGLFPDHELPPVSQPPSVSGALTKQASSEEEAWREIAKYLKILLTFINEMNLCLQEFNEQSYNNFKLRVGVNLGPVTAGVIGATKPQYDIWGNTVNVASRMESTCEPNMIQVTEDVYLYLKFDEMLKFTCRGKINVKGKGSMTTYYVEVKNDKRVKKQT